MASSPSRIQAWAQDEQKLKGIANTVRGLCMDTVLKSKSGHIGLPLGGADMATFLYFAVMNHSPHEPQWIDRDRFVLSAGHGSALQYALLHLAGYAVSTTDLQNFRQLGSNTPGHPEYGLTPGVECTTGPLGQGLGMAVGMALGEAHLSSQPTLQGERTGHSSSAEGNEEPLDHRTFVIAGDGCLMEGIASEAASLAGHLGLNKLIVLYDDNRITIDGHTDISFSEDVPARFKALGWNVFAADGHDFSSLGKAMDQALQESEKPAGASGPSLIVCRTTPGKGLSRWEDQAKVHGNPHTAEDVQQAKSDLGLDPHQSFWVSPAVSQDCAAMMEQRVAKHKRWNSLWGASWLDDFHKRTDRVLRFSAEDLKGAQTSAATRQSAGAALSLAASRLPAMIGGSADLAGSNVSTLADSSFMKKGECSGRNIHFGVREHAMGAITNGLALHGGLRPFCATFAVFSDYMRPAIRLAALMQIPSVFIFTHDSYAVGEDGPTHQPIEHAASLRAIPELQVYRPADSLESFAAWENICGTPDRPTALLLTRQKLENLDTVLQELGLPVREPAAVVSALRVGAYLLKDHNTEGEPDRERLTVLASGSETADALRAAALLEKGQWEDSKGRSHRFSARVVSVPAINQLTQSPTQLHKLVPLTDRCMAVEAGATQSFAGVVGRDGFVFGLDRFGESAPAGDLKKHFGFTPDALCERMAMAAGCRRRDHSS